jgi:hypothetical protein
MEVSNNQYTNIVPKDARHFRAARKDNLDDYCVYGHEYFQIAYSSELQLLCNRR